jgi:hypothetical protein
MAYQFDNGNRPEFFIKYLSYIYNFHTSKMDYNQVYDAIDTQHFVDFGNAALKYKKDGMTKEDVLLAIYNNGNQNIMSKVKPPKNGWLNLVRKLIVIIDDEF